MNDFFKSGLSLSPNPSAELTMSMRLLRHSNAVNSDQLIKQGIWLYFILLIVEGALRKWFLPGLSTPLLIVRDPLAIWLVVMAWKKGFLPSTFYLSAMMLIGVLGIFTAVLVGHGNLFVALYGARILLIHFPLIFVIGKIFSREDVVKMGRVVVWISIPMLVVLVFQFFSPQSAWINRGVGGDVEGAGFHAGANGYYRPSGTFSFITGVVNFYSLVACYILYFWFQSKDINRWVLITATIALVASIPVSISRSLFFGVGVSLLFVFIAAMRKPGYLIRIVPIFMVLVLAFIILSNNSLFQTSTEAFFARFESANQTEGGLEGVVGDRYFGGMITALSKSSEIPFFGYGQGMGTNVGSMLLTGGLTFLIAEEEWGRVIGELGALMGIAVILLRLGLCARISIACYQKLLKGDLLPWMLLSFCLLIVPQGQWARPTTLGFSVLIAGLTIASLRWKPDGVVTNEIRYF